MKNILITGLLLFTLTLYGQQRVIDLQMLRIAQPDTVKDNKDVAFSFTFKNNGPDKVLPGDTIYYSLQYEISIQILRIPEFTFLYHTIENAIEVGDSFNISGIIPLKVDVKVNTTGTVCAVAYTVNGTNIKSESSIPTSDHNNGKCKSCVFYDPYLVKSNQDIPAHSQIQAKLFPNPAGNSLNIEITGLQGDAATIEIYDVAGKLVKKGTPKKQGETVYLEDISALTNGIYFISIKNNAGAFNGKFIKLAD